MKYTVEQKIAELKREIRMREKVYWERVAKGEMRADEAQKRIDIVRDILSDYERMVQPKLIEEVQQ